MIDREKERETENEIEVRETYKQIFRKLLRNGFKMIEYIVKSHKRNV